MRTIPRVPLLLLSMLLTPLLIASVPERAEACGGYGDYGGATAGRITSVDPATEGYSVTATCGERSFKGHVRRGDQFSVVLPVGAECQLRVVAHECYTADREVVKTVRAGQRDLVVEIPGYASSASAKNRRRSS